MSKPCGDSGLLVRVVCRAETGAACYHRLHYRQAGRGRPSVSELQGIARFRFHPGKVEEFKRLAAQAMEIVRSSEPGTLQYETYFNDDESEAIVLERYRDSQALIEHGQHMADLMEPILATADVTGELLGAASPELRALITGDVPQVFPTRFLALHS